METLEGKPVGLIERFENLTAELAPQAVELALLAARVAAANQVAVLAIAVCVAIWAFRVPLVERMEKAIDDDSVTGFFVPLLRGIAGLIGIAVILQHISIWPWVGIFYPEVWIAKQVLGW